MAVTIDALLRQSGALAVNPALVRWAQAMSRHVDDGLSGDTANIIGLLRAANIPTGSPFFQWAMAASLATVPSALGYPQVDELSRQIDQKPPGGGLDWIQALSQGVSGAVA